MNFKVINAGNCVICGRRIKIARKNNKEFPNIFFCSECEEQRVRRGKSQRESKDKNNDIE